jgi:hypothetical protein
MNDLLSTDTSDQKLQDENSASRGGRQNGPPLPIPAVFLLVLSVVSAILGSSGTRPDDNAVRIVTYDLDHHGVLIALATVVSATSIPLAIWAAVVYRRLRRLGVSAPGATMAFAGGLVAAASVSLSGIATWVAAVSPDRSEPALARALTLLAFGTGGPGFVVPLGLMVAGVSVPALILHLLPRALGWIGIALAVLGMVSTFTLAASALYPLLPIGRFGIAAWLLVVSFILPRDRRRRPTSVAPGAARAGMPSST